MDTIITVIGSFIALAFAALCFAWMTVLPSIGVLWLMGWL